MSTAKIPLMLWTEYKHIHKCNKIWKLRAKSKLIERKINIPQRHTETGGEKIGGK